MIIDNHRKLAFLALIVAASIWGASAAIMKLTLLTVPPYTLAFIRFGAASLLLLPFVFRKLRVETKDIPLLVLATVGAVTLHIPFFFFGLTLTTALNAGIIIASTPLFTLLFAHLFLSERVPRNLILGSVLGMAGIGLIIGKDIVSRGISLSPIGDFLILMATLMFVFYEIASKKLFVRYHPSVITFYAFAFGSLSLSPFALQEFQTDSQWLITAPPGAFWGILYGIFLSSFAAYSLWQWGLSKLEASRVGFFFYLDPVVSTIAAVVLLSEVITPLFVVGSILIFLGIFLAEGRLPYHHLQK